MTETNLAPRLNVRIHGDTNLGSLCPKNSLKSPCDSSRVSVLTESDLGSVVAEAENVKG